MELIDFDAVCITGQPWGCRNVGSREACQASQQGTRQISSRERSLEPRYFCKIFWFGQIGIFLMKWFHWKIPDWSQRFFFLVSLDSFCAYSVVRQMTRFSFVRGTYKREMIARRKYFRSINGES